MISWPEIDRIFYQKTTDKEYLCVALKKPETFLNNQPAIKRFFSRAKYSDSTFIKIPLAPLPIKPWVLIKEIRQAHPEVRIHYPFPNLDDMDLNPNSHLDLK